MAEQRVSYDCGVTLVGGAPVQVADLDESLELAPVLVAADGGADGCLAAGRIPDAVIGDLDSISPTARQILTPARIVHDPDQNTTDFEKCLARIDSPLILGLGFLGGRVDHELAALASLARAPSNVVLIGASEVCLHAPADLRIDLPVGSRLSLFPMARVAGRSEGLEWPIGGLDFAPDRRIGTSNRVSGPVRLAMDGAGMLLILPRAALRAVLDAKRG